MTDIAEQAARVLTNELHYTANPYDLAEALSDAGLLREPARTLPTREQNATVPTTQEVLSLAEWAILQAPNPERFGGVKTGLRRWLSEERAQAWDEGHDAGYHACHWEHLTGGPCADDPNDSEAINPYRAQQIREGK